MGVDLVWTGGARTKAAAVQFMYALGHQAPEPLGRGSKEKRSAVVAVGRAVGLDLAGVSTKIECGRRVAERVGVAWDSHCYSRGDTLTLTGLNRLVSGAVTYIDGRNVAAASEREDQTVVDTSEIEQSIAEGIANLSQSDQTPSEFEPIWERLTADQISFSTGSWRPCLAQIQGWLRLDNVLDELSPVRFLSSLATGLGEPAAANEAVVLPRLAERIDRALEIRQMFDNLLEAEAEGGATRESATQAWLSAWDEIVEEDESETSGPIKAEAATWPITEFVGFAQDEQLILTPSYQRADVWPTTSAQQLIESIVRGIPLPSVILLQRTLETQVIYEVVDGKQRLTSILRFVGMHPRALDLVQEKAAAWPEPDVAAIFRDDYPAFKKLWKAHEAESLTAAKEREYYFPFAMRSGLVKPLKGLDQLKGKYYCQVRNEIIDVVGEPRQVESLFERSSSKYKVPVIVYGSASSEQIHEVFSLYNKQGKHLNAEEIRNALFHHLDFMRALLVTAGDSDDVAEVAPFLTGVWAQLASTPEVLDDYGFGKAGYKRTKLLSWVAAALLYSDGKAPSRSTAAWVNALLKRVEDTPGDRLRDPAVVRNMMLLLDRALDAHALVPDDVWAPRFKNAQQKSKWQELQLVASLIGLTAAAAALGDDFEQRVDDALDRIGERSQHWIRPTKTQTKEQWGFIAQVVAEMLAVLEVAPADADAEITAAYGSSGLARLLPAPTGQD